MATGTVKWFNTTKGYGFIAPEDGGKDIFVHISAVERSGLTGLQDNATSCRQAVTAAKAPWIWPCSDRRSGGSGPACADGPAPHMDFKRPWDPCGRFPLRKCLKLHPFVTAKA